MKWMVGLAAWCAAFSAVALEVGEMAPAFTGRNQDGVEWKLAEQLGGKPIVVYFYPAAMTGGCTKQACAYRDHLAGGDPAFTVVGVSGDPVANLKHFQTAEKLNFDLLSDPEGAVAKAFGVPVQQGEKSIQRTVEGKEVELKRGVTTARWTFVVGADGKVVYKSDAVKATEDLKQLLAFLEQE